jgi:hypothetical protein
MDEQQNEPTTKFTRDARTRRMLDRLRQGWGYRDLAREEGLSERRVRQIVAEHVKRCEPIAEDEHAALQIERLSFAMKVAGEALAKGDIRAIAPFLKAVDRLDRYQTMAREAPRPSPEIDKLVIKTVYDRVRREIEAERSPTPGFYPASSWAPAAEPSPPIAHETPAVDETPAVAEAPATAAEPAPPLAGPDGPIAPAAPGFAAAEPAPPPAPAAPAPRFAEPDMSNFAMSNYLPTFWG